MKIIQYRIMAKVIDKSNNDEFIVFLIMLEIEGRNFQGWFLDGRNFSTLFSRP